MGKENSDYGRDGSDYGKENREYGRDGSDYGKENREYGKEIGKKNDVVNERNRG